MGWHPGDNHRKNVAARQQAKTDRVLARQQTKATAYEMGIDPNAAMWDGISNVAKSAADVVGDVYGAKAGAGGAAGAMDPTKVLKSDPTGTGTGTEPPKSNMMMILAAVAVVIVVVMMGKMKR